METQLLDKLVFLPPIRPDEPLYSLIARWSKFTGGAVTGQPGLNFFGSRNAVATFDLPNRLANLVNRLPECLGMQPEDFAWHCTMFPYFAAAGHPDRKAAALEAMIKGVGDVHMTLGLTAFKIRPVTRLRFCAVCNRQNFNTFGEVWWSRLFNLPGVLVCPKHGKPLLTSTVDLDDLSRHAFSPASPENCPENAPPVCQPNGKQFDILISIARTSEWFLRRRQVSVNDLEEIRRAYLDRCRQVGLMKSEKKVDLCELHEAFTQYWKPVSNLLEVDSKSDLFSDLGWLDAMLRKQRKACHPLQHILLSIFLQQRAEVEPKTKHAFGNGPWVCRNPAAKHCGVNVIDHLQTYNNKGSLVGSFSCKCGYVYTCGVNPQGVIGPPRFRQGGPLHTGLLQRSLMKGESLRGLARQVGLDSKTVVRILKTAGIPVNSVMAPNASPIMSTANTDLDTPVCKRQPTNRKPRVDWDALDRSMANDVKRIVCRIQEETPPRRAAFAAIEMQLCKRGYVLKRRAKLPLTFAAMNCASELKDRFRVRRYNWWQQQLSSSGISAPDWQIIRTAGIRKEFYNDTQRAFGG